MESGPGGNLHDTLVEFVARAEPPGIPRRDLAEHPAAVFLAKNFNHQIQMPAHHPYTIGKGGFGKEFAQKRRRGVSPPHVGEADGAFTLLLALKRSLGRRDACPTLSASSS